jgi:winged helix DNA-binding protein
MRITNAQRRARLARRHRLATGTRATDPAAVAESLVALHSTDPATVFLSIQARTGSVDVGAVEDALYTRRRLLRMLGMRRTVFVVPVELAPAVQAACADAIAVRQARTYTRFLVDAGIGDGAWLADVATSTHQALQARGEASGAELSTDEPRLRTTVQLAEGKPYAARQNITTWVLFLLAAQGRIVRGRPRGTWTSTQWRWAPVDRWLPDGMPSMPVDQARADLVRRWLSAYGPGTEADLRWWTGWTLGQVRAALGTVGAVPVELDAGTGLILPDDRADEPDAAPWVALLPALDSTPMGWLDRSWFLGDHGPALFDRSGNIGPTVWADGRIIGGWAQRADGEVVWRLLEDAGRGTVDAVGAAAGRLRSWVGPARVVPRFRTPLERELTR